MSEAFLGEIKIAAFQFAPRGWAFCAGQLLPINQNQALFALLGTQYGGNGTTNFALPDLRGRVAVHRGSSIVQGQAGGQEAVTLTATQMPVHSHPLRSIGDLANASVPAGAMTAARPRGGPLIYGTAGTATTAMSPAALDDAGGSQPHPNVQPYLALNYVIALQGIFPSRD